MNIIHKLANRREILAATREAVKMHKAYAKRARQDLSKAMLEISADPAHAHLRYSEVGRLYVTANREDILADLCHGTCLTLLSEIFSLEEQLKNQ